MNSFFTFIQSILLVKLLIAHCLSDFLLQPNSWVADKKNKVWASACLYLHVLVTGLVTSLLLWNTDWWKAVLIITLSHLLIDGLKVQAEKYFKKSDFNLFVIDQLLHITVIVIVWLWMINGQANWARMTNSITGNYSFWLKSLAYIFVTTPVGYVIHFLTRKWNNDLAYNDSLRDAGKWIGILERLLILTMVFINQFSAIGFLVAAKSILRVTDKPDKLSSDPTMGRPFSSRKYTEYILIGTFLSVGTAIFTGLAINELLAIKK